MDQFLINFTLTSHDGYIYDLPFEFCMHVIGCPVNDFDKDLFLAEEGCKHLPPLADDLMVG